MEEYVFKKSFKYVTKINEVKNVLLDHDFENILQDDGVNIKGNIYLTFVIENEEKRDYEALQIPVDLFIALNEIDCLKELKLTIDHFNYEINDDEITFIVNTKLMGNNEDFISFEPTKNKKINRAMIDLLMRGEQENQQEEFNEDYLKRVEDLITKDDIDLISTPYQDLSLFRDDIIEISTDDIVNNQDDVLETNQEVQVNEKIDNIDEQQDDKLEENINEPINEEREVKKEKPNLQVEKTNDESNEKEVRAKKVPSFIDEEVKVQEVKQEEIKKESKELFKEKYASSYFYYRLKENETINDLVKIFSLKEEDILKHNKNVEFKKGQLVKIPK